MPHPTTRPSHALRAIACAFALAVFRAAHAHDFCVTTAQQLQDALDAVSGGGAYVNEDNLISVVRGTYRTGSATGGTAFHSSATASTHLLTIAGGYSTGCGGNRHPASSTILDAHGISGVMTLRRPNGRIAVSYLTFQNGESDVGAGLQVNDVVPVNGEVSFDHLIFRDNHANADGGGLYATGRSTTPGDIAVYVANSLFTGNSADHNYGAAAVTAYNEVGLFSHVTIQGNHSQVGVGGAYCGGDTSCQVEHSIAWNNTNAGLYFDTPANALVCTDYGTLGGDTPDYAADNLSVAPQFVDAANGDFHLAGDSPLLARCLSGAHRFDLDDNPYPATSRADMGAYEETIFRDGFDDDLR